MQENFATYRLAALGIMMLPFISFVLLLFIKQKRLALGVSLLSIVGAFLLCLFLLVVDQPFLLNFRWLSLPNLESVSATWIIDRLPLTLGALVTFVSALVHIYSVEYMSHDKSIIRYFGLLGLFTTAMLGIVFSSNLLVLFIFWELVGFSSYLLIGFWNQKISASKAATKAFIVNRIGDIGFLMAIGILWSGLGTVDLQYLHTFFEQGIMEGSFLIFEGRSLSLLEINLIGFGIFCGVVGKSAQFPLLVWLPDAMEGPTPASALIHAATMVAAGVYLLARTFIVLSPLVLLVITFIGAITVIMGAIAALTQNDIKKVLAYSTISQLGYMVAAVGMGAWLIALLHLITHAFFKACLFLSAGSVIHAQEHAFATSGSTGKFDPQDMRTMGGLRNQMPITFWSYTIAAFSLIGVPFFSGFLTKDAIVLQSLSWSLNDLNPIGIAGLLIPVFLVISVVLTAFYMCRQLLMVFFNDSRRPFSTEPHDGGILQNMTLVILAVLSISFFYSFNPLSIEGSWLTSFLSDNTLLKQEHGTLALALGGLHITAITLSLASVLVGLGISWQYFGKKSAVITQEPSTSLNWVQGLSVNSFYLDVVYEKIFVLPFLVFAKSLSYIDRVIVDGIINFMGVLTVITSKITDLFDRYIIDGFVVSLGMLSKWIGQVTRSIQGGNAQSYYFWALTGAVLILFWLFQLIEWKITF